MGGGLEVSPIVPPSRTFCPASPSLQWVPWASVPHLPGLQVWPADPRYYAPLRLPRLRLGVLRWSLVRRYPGVIRFFTPSQVTGPRHPAGLGGFLPRFPDPAIPKERRGSPKFPSDPSDDMPRSQTPVVSWALALAHPGLLPSGAWKPSAFPSLRGGISCGPQLYQFRGSITRPATSLPLAPRLHYWLST
jgi:hypothetical protein